MAFQVKIKLNNDLYVKDPEDTKLGKSIIGESISLIHRFGFDKFTFKKLALQINSNEQSIYRYFENKHQLLRYLIAWYWAWLEYQIEMKTYFITEPNEKLRSVIKILSESAKNDPNFEYIDESALAHIVTKTSPISYITEEKNEKEINEMLYSFKSLSLKIANIIKDCAPKYKNPLTLATSMIRMTREQIFFSKYFTDLTDLNTTQDTTTEIYNFIESIIFTVLFKNK